MKRRALAVVAVLALQCITLCLGTVAATAAEAQTSAPTTCGAFGTSALAHFSISVASPSGPQISSITLSGLPSACDGEPVDLQFWGDSSGDPTAPLSGDTLLSTADSTLDPCTQSALSTPDDIVGGSIVVPLCGSGGPAAEVSVHDLTLLALLVNGTTIPVTVGSATSSSPSGPVTASASSSGTATSPSSTGGLAFTGADVLAAAALGVAALLAGLAILVFTRRRHGVSRGD